MQRKDRNFKMFKYSVLETEKDNFKVIKMHLQKRIQNLTLKKN